MPNERDRLALDFRLKRFQRGTEYSLLVTIFAYYLMAFQGWYQLPLALFAGGRTAFMQQGEPAVVHGGISVEELMVPFVKVGYVSRAE